MKHKRRGTVKSFCTKTSWRCCAFCSSNSREAVKFYAAGSVADGRKIQKCVLIKKDLILMLTSKPHEVISISILNVESWKGKVYIATKLLHLDGTKGQFVLC